MGTQVAIWDIRVKGIGKSYLFADVKSYPGLYTLVFLPTFSGNEDGPMLDVTSIPHVLKTVFSKQFPMVEARLDRHFIEIGSAVDYLLDQV